MTTSPRPRLDEKSVDGLVCVVLGLATLALFFPASHYQFNNYDDTQYVLGNSHVQSGLTPGNILWALTSGYAANWHPLTWISHMLDCQLYGLWAGGHHLTNVLFHTANSILLYGLWRRMTGAVWRSAFVAALFAWHPMHVESVAFVAERKDVLSAFFGFFALWAYIDYAREPSRRRLATVCVVYALGLMSKPMLVTLPLLMLLLDYWPLRRAAPWSRLFLEKVPLFILSGASSLVTLWAQRSGGAMGTLQVFPLGTRLANAVHSYAAYMGKLLWPARLAVLYPYSWTIPTWEIAASIVVVAGLSAGALILGRGRPWLPMGWLWFLVSLCPVIGIVQVGGAAMADRYSYIPSVGLFVIVAWEASTLVAARAWGKPALAAVATVILLACLGQTSRQLTCWHDSLTLFQHTLEVTPNNAVAHSNLATALQGDGKIEEAKKHLEMALELSPGYASADDNLGLILYNEGDLKDAEAHFRATVKEDPTHDRAWANLGVLLLNSGRGAEAIDPLRHAVKLAPDNAYAQLGLARALDDQGKLAEAMPHYYAAVAAKPDLADAQANLGAALSTEGKLSEAAEHLEKALELDPHSWEAHYYFGNTLLAAGKFAAAVENYRKAELLRPQNLYVQLNLAAALQRLGQTNEAIAAAERCLQLATNSADAGLAARLKKQLASLRRKE